MKTLIVRAQGQNSNVGSEDAVTICEVAHQVATCLQPASRVEIACEPQAGELPERYGPSAQRAMRELSLRQSVHLREAITRDLSEHRMHAGAIRTDAWE